MLFGVGRYTVTVELPETGGLYPSGNVTYRGSRSARWRACSSPTPASQAVLSLNSDIKIPADLEAEVHSQSAVGEQFVELLPRSGTVPTAEGRRRDPAGSRYGAARHQRAAGRTPTAACRRSRRTTSRPSSTRPTWRSAGSGRSCRGSSTVPRTLAIDAAQESRPADHPDRPVQAGAGLPDRHRRTRSRRGRRTWRPSPVSCRATTRPSRASSARAPVRPTRCGHCSTGCNPRCRSCWPTWSASARSRSPTSRASNSCWCCCRRAPRSRRPSAWPTSGTPSRTTRATTCSFNLNLNTAAAVHHRLPARPAAAGAHVRGLSRPAGGRSVLPGPAGRAVQRARRPQHPVRHRARQTRTHREDVREQRAIRAAERRLQLEGRPNATLSGQADPAVAAGLATAVSASAAGSGAATDSGRRIRSGDRHVRWTGRTCVHAVQPGPECHRGANMADDAAAPEGELTKASPDEVDGRAGRVQRPWTGV